MTDRDESPVAVVPTTMPARLARRPPTVRAMGWTVRWWVHVWYGGTGMGSMADDRPHTRSVHVDSRPELDALLGQLRAEPFMRRYRFGEFDHCDDPGADACDGCGVDWKAPSFRARTGLTVGCPACPGHFVYLCTLCTGLTIRPEPGPGCRPLRRSRMRHSPPHPLS